MSQQTRELLLATALTPGTLSKPNLSGYFNFLRKLTNAQRSASSGIVFP